MRRYVYYRVATADVAAAAAAVAAFQRRWQAGGPGRVAELLRRPGETDGLVTLMEVYACADAAAAVAVETDAARATAAWRRGERHLEVFEPLA